MVRNQAVAVVAVLLLALAVEPVLIGVVPEVARFGPVDALPAAITDVDGSGGGFASHGDLLAPLPAVAVLLGWIAAFFAAGAALLNIRDVE